VHYFEASPLESWVPTAPAQIDCLNRITSGWAQFFIGLRDLVRRVVAETIENGLSTEDRVALAERLMEHISELEKAWPSFASNDDVRVLP
jgi:hypothetical protein